MLNLEELEKEIDRAHRRHDSLESILGHFIVEAGTTHRRILDMIASNKEMRELTYA